MLPPPLPWLCHCWLLGDIVRQECILQYGSCMIYSYMKYGNLLKSLKHLNVQSRLVVGNYTPRPLFSNSAIRKSNWNSGYVLMLLIVKSIVL